jgi:hypothetical protein
LQNTSQPEYVSDPFSYRNLLWCLLFRNNHLDRTFGAFIQLLTPTTEYFSVELKFSLIRDDIKQPFAKKRLEPYLFGPSQPLICGLSYFVDKDILDEYTTKHRKGCQGVDSDDDSTCTAAEVVLAARIAFPTTHMIGSDEGHNGIRGAQSGPAKREDNVDDDDDSINLYDKDGEPRPVDHWRTSKNSTLRHHVHFKQRPRPMLSMLDSCVTSSADLMLPSCANNADKPVGRGFHRKQDAKSTRKGRYTTASYQSYHQPYC